MENHSISTPAEFEPDQVVPVNHAGSAESRDCLVTGNFNSAAQACPVQAKVKYKLGQNFLGLFSDLRIMTDEPLPPAYVSSAGFRSAFKRDLKPLLDPKIFLTEDIPDISEPTFIYGDPKTSVQSQIMDSFLSTLIRNTTHTLSETDECSHGNFCYNDILNDVLEDDRKALGLIDIYTGISYVALSAINTIVKHLHLPGRCASCTLARATIKHTLHNCQIHDIPLMTPDLIEQYACDETSHSVSCSFYTRPEAYFYTSYWSPNAYRSILAVLEAIRVLGLENLHRMNKRELSKLNALYRRNFIIYFIISTFDEYNYVPGGPLRLVTLYALRKMLGYNKNYGLANAIELMAQEPGDTPLMFMEAPTDEPKDDNSESTFTWLYGYFKIFISKISHMLSMVHTGFSTIMESLSLGWFKNIFSYFTAPLKIGQTLNGVWKAISKPIYYGFVAIIVAILGVAGWFTCSTISKILSWFIPSYLTSSNQFNITVNNGLDRVMAQSPPSSPVSGAIALIAALTGLFCFDQTWVERKCKYIIALVAGSVALTTLAGCLMSFLPSIFREGLVMKYGTEDAVTDVEFEHWRTQTNALIAGSSIPRVLNASFFITKVKERLNEGQILYRKMRGPHVNTLNILYAKLIRVYNTLLKIRYEKGPRCRPYSLHFAGPSGCGKSLIMSHFIREVANVPSQDVYHVPKDPFWNGYMGERVVVFDEFLIGSDETLTREMEQYLDLVSTKLFSPPLASLDASVVGQKGTQCVPKFVLTINNTRWNNAPNGDPTLREALQRRRNRVISFKPVRRFQATNPDGTLKHEIDFSRMTEQEKRECAFVTFFIHDGEFPGPDQARDPEGQGMSYDELVRHIKYDYEQTIELYEQIHSTYNQQDLVVRSPEEIFQEILADLECIPKGPVGITDVITGLANTTAQEPQIESSFLPETIYTTETADQAITAYHTFVVQSFHEHLCCNKLIIHPNSMRLTHANPFITCTRCFARSHCADCPPVHELNLEAHQNEDGTWLVYVSSPFVECENLELSQEEWYTFLFESGFLIKPVTRLSNWSVPSFIAKNATGIIIGAIAGLAVALRHLFKNKDEISAEFGFRRLVAQSGSTKSGSRNSSRPRQLNKMNRAAFREGHGNSPDDVPIARLDFQYQGGATKWGWCIPVFSRWVLTYKHGFFNSQVMPDENTIITYSCHGEKGVCHYDPEATIEIPGSDLVVLYLDIPKINMFRDIRKKFVPMEFVENVRALPVKLLRTDGHPMYGLATHAVDVDYALPTGGNLMVNEGFWTPMVTQTGDCGLPLVVTTATSSKLAGCILGLHTAGGRVGQQMCGFAAMISREELELIGIQSDDPVLDISLIEEKNAQSPVSDALTIEEMLTLPNCKNAVEIAPDERIHLCRESKLKPSIFYGTLPVYPEKQLPLLSKFDQRAMLRDPVENSIRDVLSSTHPAVDHNLVAQVFDAMYENYDRDLVFPTGRRRLNFSEAVGGIPGKLCSVNLDTSPGYPLCFGRKKPGKRDFAWFDGDVLVTDPGFERDVGQVLTDMRDYRGEELPMVFAGYLKDELMSQKKIEECRTRMIFANNFIDTTAFRMTFGSVLAAFNSSAETTPLAIGLNQYSYDMHLVYQYLTALGSRNFVAGDYRSFDKRFHPLFRDFAYALIFRLAKSYPVDPATDAECAYLLEHETRSPAQVGKFRFWTKSNHMSGCFFTTVINCLVNEAYFRYIFALTFPTKIYDQVVRAKFLGDDHILTVRDIEFFPTVIAPLMKELGQDYTSAQKDSELEDHYLKFEECTFLGATPVRLDGRYTGALRQSTIYQAVQFSRNGNLTIHEEVTQMIELASQWGEPFFSKFRKEIESAYAAMGLPPVLHEIPSIDISRAVAKRTASSEERFIGWFAQCPYQYERDLVLQYEQTVYDKTVCMAKKIIRDMTVQREEREKMADGMFEHAFDRLSKAKELWTEEAPAIRPKLPEDGAKAIKRFLMNHVYDVSAQSPDGLLSKITATATTTSSIVGERDHRSTSHLAVNEQQYMLQQGTASMLIRDQITWTSAQTVGTVLAAYTVPNDLLALGPSDVQQNMPFDYTLFAEFGVEMTLQVATNPFYQGLVAVYFYPLIKKEQMADGVHNTQITGCRHMFLYANENTTATMTIPFDLWRNALNTYAMAGGEEFFGTVFVQVFSPLVMPTSGVADPVSISVYSGFPGAKFTIPRPPGNSGLAIALRQTRLQRRIEQARVRIGAQLIAQGNTASTTNNVYNVGDTSGSMTIQNSPKTDTKGGNDLDTKLDLSLPMDNPALVGGAIPVMNQFCSMSKSNGVEVTVGLSFHPQMTFHEHDDIFEKGSTNIPRILALKGFLTSFQWDTSMVDGTQLLTIPLHSLFWDVDNGPREVPFNVALLNEFMFWRADISLTFMPVKTNYQSGRLMVSMAYQTPESVILPSQRGKFKVTTLDFTGDNKVQTIVIDYQSGTEFLRTFEGAVKHETQNQSIGTAMITVANRLNAVNTVVPTSVEVLIFISIENARVYEVKPSAIISYPGYGQGTNDAMPFNGGSYRGPPLVNPISSAPVLPIPIIPETPNISANITAEVDVPSLIKPFTDLIAQAPDDQAPSVDVIPPTEGTNSPPEQHMTEQESNVVPSRPCRLELGRKFPYVLSDIVEIVRRHLQMPEVTDMLRAGDLLFTGFQTSGYFSIGTTTTSPLQTRIYTLPVKPYNVFTNYFGAWAGTMKYRIFAASSNIPRVMLLNTRKSDSRLFNEVTEFYGNGGQTTQMYLWTLLNSPGPDATYVDFGVPRPIPVEKCFELPSATIGTGFIDVSVPFNSHYQFLSPDFAIGEDYLEHYHYRIGIETYDSDSFNTVPNSDTFILPEVFRIYQAAGDDFRFGLFRPPKYTTYIGCTTFSSNPIPPSWNGKTLVLNGQHIALTLEP